MKKEDLFESIGSIDDELIERSSRKSHGSWYKIAAGVACAVIICAVAVHELPILKNGEKVNSGQNKTEITNGNEEQKSTAQPDKEVEKEEQKSTAQPDKEAEKENEVKKKNTEKESAEKESTDYKNLFTSQMDNNAMEEENRDFSLDVGQPRYEYGTKDNIPFEIDGTQYFDKGNVVSYCDENKKVINTSIEYTDSQSDKWISIIVSENGTFYGNCNANDIVEKGVMHLGTSVYALSLEDTSEVLYLKAFFQKGNETFSIESRGLSYGECGTILDSVIESDLNFAALDKTNAVYVANDK